MTAVFWGAGVIAALLALHNFALWLERRGWLYYKYKKGSGTASSNVFMEMQSFVDPAAEHLRKTRHEIKQERRAEDDYDD